MFLLRLDAGIGPFTPALQPLRETFRPLQRWMRPTDMTDRPRTRETDVQQLRREYDAAFHRFVHESRSLHRLRTESAANAEALQAAEQSFAEASQRYRRRRNSLADRLLHR